MSRWLQAAQDAGFSSAASSASSTSSASFGAQPSIPAESAEPAESADLLKHLSPDQLDAFEERAAIIHEAHARTRADDGALLPDPIFGITRNEAEMLAAVEQGHADADSLYGEIVARWATEINRLATLRAASPDGAKALKSAQAFIAEGWALQAARLGWEEVELFGVCPRAPWARHDRKGVAFGGAVQAVTAEAVTYIGGRRGLKIQVNNDGGAVPIWTLA
jgi:hypothetical protein